MKCDFEAFFFLFMKTQQMNYKYKFSITISCVCECGAMCVVAITIVTLAKSIEAGNDFGLFVLFVRCVCVCFDLLNELNACV